MLKDLAGQATDLDVHLKGGNSLPRAGNLEVHIAVVIFGAGDVREDGIVIALLHKAHGHAGHCTLEGDSRVIQCKARAADRSHGRRSIGLENVRHDANAVWRFIRTRQNRGDCALRQCSVTDFPATGPRHTSRFTNRKRREVVVEHEVFLLLPFIALQALSVIGGAQCCRHQGLRFTTREQCRTMSAGKNAGLDRDLANLIERATVGTNPSLVTCSRKVRSRSSS